jgi:hypothetical protein
MANEGRIIRYFVQAGDVIRPNTGGYASLPVAFGIAFDWSVRSQSLVNNSSVIDWAVKFVLVDETAWDFYEIGTPKRLLAGALLKGTTDGDPRYASLYVKINGNAVFSNFRGTMSGNESTPYASGSTTIAHNADGTKSVDFEIRFTPYKVVDQFGTAAYYQASTAYSMSGTEILEEIPKKAIILSATDFTDESNPTITYNIPSGTVDVQVGILWQDGSIAVPYKDIPNPGSSYTIPLTSDERKNLYTTVLSKGIASTKVIFSIKSRSSYTNATFTEQFAGTKTLTIVNYMPTIDPELWDFNPVTVALTAGVNATKSYKIVKYFSEVAYDIKAEGHKGADIAYISVKNGDRTNTTTGGTFDNIIDSKFIFTATDTYGRRVSGDMELSPSNWVNYTKLTCNAKASEMSADGDVAITITGKYFKGSFGAVNNALIVSYTKEEFRGGTETIQVGELVPTMNDNDYTATFTISGLDYKSSYNIVVHVSDKLMNAESGSTVVAPTPIFDWSRTDFNFNVPVTIQGGSVPTIVAQGTSGIWTYRTWSDGTAECWGKKDVSVTFPSTANWGSLYTTGAISASNVSFPYGLFAETPVVNASLLIRSVGGILMAPGGNDSNKATWDQTGVYEIARGWYVSGTQYYTINYQVIGKWK